MWTKKTSTAGTKLLQNYSKLKEFEVDLKTKDSVCIGSILKFESKWLMWGRAPCIASILNCHGNDRLEAIGQNNNEPWTIGYINIQTCSKLLCNLTCYDHPGPNSQKGMDITKAAHVQLLCYPWLFMNLAEGDHIRSGYEYQCNQSHVLKMLLPWQLMSSWICVEHWGHRVLGEDWALGQKSSGVWGWTPRPPSFRNSLRKKRHPSHSWRGVTCTNFEAPFKHKSHSFMHMIPS